MRIVVTDTRYVDLDFINARTLIVTHNLEAPKIIKEKTQITEIQFYNYSIKVGDTIKINVSQSNKNKVKRFYVSQIVEGKLGFTLTSEELTKTSTFLFPLITNKNDTGQLYEFDHYFYNAYLYNEDEQLKEFNDGKHLFVKYRFFDVDRFKELESLLLKNSNYVKTIEPNSDFTLYIFSIPQRYHIDIYHFKRGKYSHIDKNSKSKIVTFHKAGMTDWIYEVLQNSKRLRGEKEYELDCRIPAEIDLCSKPIKEQETYKC